MQSWKKLEEYIASYLKWKRLTKKHYGDSKWDLSGDGFKGDSKHYAKHRIHSIKQKADMLYKDDILIFTKVKGTHYTSDNVLVTLSLGVFNALLQYKRIAEKVDKRTDVPTFENNNLVTDLKFQIGFIKEGFRKINKILKEMEEVK